MQSTRQNILHYLEKEQRGSVADLSRALEMTAANVRHHLGILQSEGLVELVGQQRLEGRGRPRQIFGLTWRVLDDSLLRLLTTLWLDLIGERPTQRRLTRLRRLARRLIGESGKPTGALTQRLYHTIQRLKHLKFQARWEAHKDSPHLILEDCPFALLQPTHPEICQLDRQIIQELLGETVEQIAVRKTGPLGPGHCAFSVKLRPPGDAAQSAFDQTRPPGGPQFWVDIDPPST